MRPNALQPVRGNSFSSARDKVRLGFEEMHFAISSTSVMA